MGTKSLASMAARSFGAMWVFSTVECECEFELATGHAGVRPSLSLMFRTHIPVFLPGDAAPNTDWRHIAFGADEGRVKTDSSAAASGKSRADDVADAAPEQAARLQGKKKKARGAKAQAKADGIGVGRGELVADDATPTEGKQKKGKGKKRKHDSLPHT